MAISTRQANRLLRGIHNIPPLAGVVEHLCALLNSDNPDIKAVAETIQADPGLTSRLLRLANSPFLGLCRTISTVDQVVILLGLARIYHLSIGLATADLKHHKRLWDAIDAAPFWRHSVAVAQIAMHLALTLDDQELACQAFTAGIIHELGHCVFAQVDPYAYRTMIASADTDEPLEIRERRAYGLDHATAGAQLCRHWRLPETQCQAIEELPMGSVKRSHPLGTLLRIADTLAGIAGLGLSQPIVYSKEFFAYCHHHGVSQNTLVHRCREIPDKLASYERDFELGLSPWPLTETLAIFRGQKVVVHGADLSMADRSMVELVRLVLASLQFELIDAAAADSDTLHLCLEASGATIPSGIVLDLSYVTATFNGGSVNGGVDIERLRDALINALSTALVSA